MGDLLVDEAAGFATLAAQPLQLTRREFDLLAFLAAHPSRVFSRVDLLDRVWGEDFLGTERTVDQHVAQLRALIGAAQTETVRIETVRTETVRIETVRGRGYRLVGE